jgi:hypothetical protein
MRFVMSNLFGLLLSGCSEPDYAIVSERDFLSPDGRFVASIVEETHFNTTGYDKHIGLRKAGERRPYPGNVWRFGPGDHVAVAWTSPTSVVVQYAYEVQRDGPSSTNLLGIVVTFGRESLRKMIAESIRSSEREPADSLTEKSNVIGGSLPSLTSHVRRQRTMSTSNDDDLFEALKAMRARYADWRFGQLVCNVASWARGAQPSSVWDVEDRELMQAAQDHLRKREEQDD